jgi:hypothetical protein
VVGSEHGCDTRDHHLVVVHDRHPDGFRASHDAHLMPRPARGRTSRRTRM